MLIRFLTSQVGADFVRNPGDVVELPDTQATRLIEAGYAVPQATEEPVETTDDPKAVAVETRKTPKKARRKKESS